MVRPMFPVYREIHPCGFYKCVRLLMDESETVRDRRSHICVYVLLKLVI